MCPNQTNTQVQSLDHYLTDETIIHLIRNYWKGISDQTFYENCPEVRDAFFSPPYPSIAHTELGYPFIKQEPGVAQPQTPLTQPEFDELNLEESLEGAKNEVIEMLSDTD